MVASPTIGDKAHGEGHAMDQRELAGILERLESLRARSKQLGKDRQRLIDHIDEAVSQLNQAAAELAESRAEAEHELRRPR